MKYYIKKCAHQELGSVEEDGRPHRGRYLLTSMNEEVLSMFPPLSEAVLNDSTLLPIIFLNTGKKVYCNFVYHNDKFHGSTAKRPRNEHRIYLNQEMEGGKLLFKKNDILIFRKHEYLDEDKEIQYEYFLELINDKKSNLYKTLDRYIQDSAIRGGYAVIDTLLESFEDKVTKLISGSEINVSIDETVTEAIIKDTSKEKIEQLFSSSAFRDFVMVGYENLCAVTRTVIKYNAFTNLDAAHIMPKSHGGTFLPSNGLALSKDMHWAFDKGFFTFSDDFKIIVHKEVQSKFLQSFSDKEIYIPKNDFFKPNVENIRYHRNNVFGLFLTSGRL